MTFSPGTISNNILKRAFEENVDVSPMKLQKLLYFVASEYAKKTGEPLLNEPFRAWSYGPVIWSVYDEFRAFGGAPIRKYAKDANGTAYQISETDHPKLKRAIERVWTHAKGLSAVELSRITHEPGSAWFTTYQRQRSDYISEDAIKADTTYTAKLGL